MISVIVKRLKSTALTSTARGIEQLKDISRFSNHSRVSAACIHSTTSSQENSQVLIEESEQDLEAGTPDKLFKLIEVEVRGNDPAVLRSYQWFTTTAANHLGIRVGKSWTPARPEHQRYSLLRSVHVNKKCQVQYEFRTYFHFMQFHRLTGSTADTFLEYIQRNLPEGVAMKVTRVGLETIPDHIQVPEKEDSTV